jgi:RNA polymerase sigma-70 factor (ECF subfamily)
LTGSPGISAPLPATTPDLELVRRAKAGDFDALETLITRHEQKVYSLALRIMRHRQDAEDVVQQTFLSALEHLGSFREESSFLTWLMRIATHAALKIIRKRRGLDVVSLDAAHSPDDPTPLPHPEFIADWRASPRELAARRETRQLLDAALNQLDEKHRLVFLLRDVEDLSVRDTAQALGLTEANVKVRLLRARLALREHLTRAFGDPTRRLEPHRHEH